MSEIKTESMKVHKSIYLFDCLKCIVVVLVGKKFNSEFLGLREILGFIRSCCHFGCRPKHEIHRINDFERLPLLDFLYFVLFIQKMDNTLGRRKV